MMSAELYTDASYNANDNKGKCACVLMTEDGKEYLLTQKFNIISLNTQYPNIKMNSIQLEFIAIIEFTKYLINKNISNVNLTCYTDSHNVFDCVHNLCAVNGNNQMLTYKLNEKLNILKSRNVNMEIRWIKGHSGNYGNSKVDMFTRGSNKVKKLKRNNLLPIINHNPFNYVVAE